MEILLFVFLGVCFALLGYQQEVLLFAAVVYLLYQNKVLQQRLEKLETHLKAMRGVVARYSVSEAKSEPADRPNRAAEAFQAASVAKQGGDGRDMDIQRPQAVSDMPPRFVQAARSAHREDHMPVSAFRSGLENKTKNDDTGGFQAAPPEPSASFVQASARASDTAASNPPRQVYKVKRRRDAERQNASNPLWTWFWHGNPLLKTGMVLLFLGLAFLLRLAAEYVHFPIEARYFSVAALGAAAVWSGGRLARKRRTYGLAVQGFGMAVLYLTVLAALRLHHLLPVSVAFACLVAIVVAMIVLAVRGDALILAQIAAAGGVVTPVLVSGSGSHVVLFAYLALLNTGIAVIAWFKSWRSLNLIGFVGTFLIGMLWGARAYTPEHFVTTEPFLLYHAALYTWVVWRFACLNGEKGLPEADNDADLAALWRHAVQYGVHIGRLDAALLCGTALAAFSLQYRMVADMPYGAAWSALAFAAAYAAVAVLAVRQPVFRAACAVLAAVFFTLSVPFALNGQWTAAIWSLEAALVYAFGTYLRQPWLRLGALLVGIVAALLQLAQYHWFTDSYPVLMQEVSRALWTAAGGAVVAVLGRNGGKALWEQWLRGISVVAAGVHLMLLPLLWLPENGVFPVLASVLVLWPLCRKYIGAAAEVLLAVGLLLFCMVAWYHYPEIRYLPTNDAWSGIHKRAYGSAGSLYWLAAAVLIAAAARLMQRQRYSDFAAISAWTAVAVSCGFGLAALLNLPVLPENWGAVVWFALWAAVALMLSWRQGAQAALAFGVVFALLWQPYPPNLAVLAAATLLNFWILRLQNDRAPAFVHAFGLMLFTVLWLLFITEHTGRVWHITLSGLVLCTVWYACAYGGRALSKWLRHSAPTYRHFCALVLAAWCAVWLLYANVVEPSAPWRYLPLLNPVFVLGAAMCWAAADTRKVPLWTAGVAAWFAVSAEVLRGGYFFGGIAWNLSDLLSSFPLQAALSVVWTAMGIALMITGNRSLNRLRWQAGAALLGLVVAKLFFVELADSGGIARIVSFIAVGLMMVAVGWFAPVPPHNEQDG